MAEKNLRYLWEKVSRITPLGEYDTFRESMQKVENQKYFYDFFSDKLDLGEDFDTFSKRIKVEKSVAGIIGEQIKESASSLAELGTTAFPTSPETGAKLGALFGAAAQVYQTGQNVLTAATSELLGQEDFKEALEQEKKPSELIPQTFKELPGRAGLAAKTFGTVADIAYDPFLLPVGKVIKGVMGSGAKLASKIEGIKGLTTTQDAIKAGKTIKESEIPAIKSELDKLFKQTKTLAETDLQAASNVAFQRQMLREALESKQGKIVDIFSPEQEIIRALKEAKPLIKKQKAIYSAERSEKLGAALSKEVKTEQEMFRAKGKLKGELTKVDFEPLREKVSQEIINNTIKKIFDSNELWGFEKWNASEGLERMLAGQLPREHEVKLLNKLFGEEFVKELQRNRTMLAKAKEVGVEIANIPRSVLASADLSAGFRQGITVLPRHPGLFFKNWVKQFKLFGSEKYYQELLNTIHSSPNYPKAVKAKVSFTELGKTTSREERFMSNYAEKIPYGVGKIVRGSGRAYTGFLDKLRMDLFDYMVNYGAKFGKANDAKYLEDAAKFINITTGRGGLGKLEPIATELNATFFSPRLLSSRIQFLNPITYIKADPIARRERIKTLLSFAGMAMAVSGVAKVAGADVEDDPTNANFAKIKVGNTRYDILGGHQQPIRAAAQIIAGKVTSSTTGKEITLGEGFKALTADQIAQRFLEMKLAPTTSFALQMARGGVNAIGEKQDVPTAVINRLIPMVAQDMKDLYDERGLEGIPMAVPAIFGVGVQTYGGVESWGLQGKKYPKLNKELNRVKSSMGFPATSVYGYSLSVDEYKRYRERAGKRIAETLTKLIDSDGYQNVNDAQKKQLIEKTVDLTKDAVKIEMFPAKQTKSTLRTLFRAMGTNENKIDEQVEKLYQGEAQ